MSETQEIGFNPNENEDEFDEDDEDFDNEVDEDDEEKESAEELKEKVQALISEIKPNIMQAFNNDNNAEKLNNIFKLAKTNYRKDPGEWEDLLRDIDAEMSPIEDDDEIADVLERYERKAKSLS